MKKKTILPPAYFYSALIISLLLNFIFPVLKFIPFPYNLFGIAPIIFGAVLNLRADKIFKEANTTVKPFQESTAMLTHGPFSWCRHPMYLGMTAILAGVSLLCGSITSFAGPVIYWIIIRVKFIGAEEQSMLNTFGEEYSKYIKKVHSWI
jgi:protein-S-isoprenylcysteine O-methyltransferase Ste14